MRWSERPYWLKGGLVALPFSLIFIPLTLFISRALGAGEDMLWYVVPEFFLVSLALAMRAEPAAAPELVAVLLQALAIFLTRFFLTGAILGQIYAWFKRNARTAFFIPTLIVFYAMFLFYISFSTQDTWKAYSQANSVADCKSFKTSFINNFKESRCIRELAMRNEDVRICDNISRAQDMNTVEDERGFCYEEVAHFTNDASICASITSKQKRDSCHVWFLLCEGVKDAGWQGKCWERKASKDKDPSYCAQVPENRRANCLNKAR